MKRFNDNELDDMIREAFTEKFEYLLGKDLLVAPVITQGAAKRSCYLPQDAWVHVWSGQCFDGGDVVVRAEIGFPPVFIRKNSEWYDKIMKGLPPWQNN